MTDNGKMLTKQVDKATVWSGIMGIDNKRSESIATLFENEWISRYPRPRRVVHDNVGEFVGYEFQELFVNYGILSVPTTVKNSRANSPVERLHLSIRDMLRTSQFCIGEYWIDE